jgi:regulator of protease activity HflC (stomatin/prohibitin superfamily)
MSKEYPDDINADLVRPAVEGVTYPLFARYTVRDIFSQQRVQIQKEITAELQPKFASMGLILRGVEMGKVDLPPDFRAGMEKLLAEELETEKIRYTLQLKEAGVKQSQLEAQADKARRIEAKGEADSRQKLADAEAYRLDLVGKANAGQMEREGALIARYPLLIQKTLADKLSDRVQVIIAPTPSAGQFIGSNLIGGEKPAQTNEGER